jgi:2-oxoglutarate ferredoxin oxidoreductase subunit delta
MAKVRGAIVVDVEKCKGCEVCVASCPVEVIALAQEVNGKGYRYAFMHHPDACTGCASCALVCPDSVISVYRVKIAAIEQIEKN